ncbi:MAG: BatA domain-containing protein, partial [Gemmataceae bacterium]
MFLHGYLLFGLLLAGVPVALHLLLRQQPRRVVFPAFRFLAQRRQTNQRRMRFRHLLLLLLRVAVLAALVLAFARPRLAGDRTGAALDRPVVAALLFDTSPSTGYTSAGVTRLDEALARGRELLDEMDPASRVAVLDSREPVAEPLQPVAEARGRLKGLQTRPGAGSINRAVERGLDLLARSRAEAKDDGPPHLLVVFSDRTRGCWDARGARPAVPDGVSVLFV